MSPINKNDTPECWLENEDVEDTEFTYCDRSPSDWVVSGPLDPYKGAGRVFPTWKRAEEWARSKYGPLFKGRPAGIPEESTRWAFVIRRVKN